MSKILKEKLIAANELTGDEKNIFLDGVYQGAVDVIRILSNSGEINIQLSTEIIEEVREYTSGIGEACTGYSEEKKGWLMDALVKADFEIYDLN